MVLAGHIAGRLLEFAEATSDYVGVTDERGNVVYLNTAARTRLGLGADYAGLSTADVFPPSTFERYYHEIRPALLRGETWVGNLEVFQAGGSSDDVWMGVFGNVGPTGEVESLVCWGRDLTGLREREAVLLHLATHDDLTGLANRLLAVHELERAVDKASVDGGVVAAIFCDVDGLKAINDERGHHAGDELLRVLAARLAGAVRPDDVAARLGGDEFVVIGQGFHTTSEVHHFVERLEHAVCAEPLHIDDTQIELSVSMGVAVGVDGMRTAEEMLREADEAMYRCKLERRRVGSVTAAAGAGQAGAVHDLAVALTQGRIAAQLAPIVRLGAGAVVGAEASACVITESGQHRFLDPLRHPAPLGVAGTLDLTVLREAVALADMAVGELGWVDVPIAATSLRQPQVYGYVRDLAARCCDYRVRLRMAASAFERGAGDLLDVLTELRAQGVGLRLDGIWSSGPHLELVAELRPDALSVPAELVADLPSGGAAARAVRTIAGLGSALDAEVLACGVETRPQLELAAEAGCTLAAGARVVDLVIPPLACAGGS